MAEDSDLEKTEPASPRQLEKAREQGDVPRSREIGTFTVLAAAALGFWISGEAMVRQLKHLLLMGLQFKREQLFDPQRLGVDWGQQLFDLLLAFLPLAGLLLTPALVAGLPDDRGALAVVRAHGHGLADALRAAGALTPALCSKPCR